MKIIDYLKFRVKFRYHWALCWFGIHMQKKHEKDEETKEWKRWARFTLEHEQVLIDLQLKYL